MGSVLSPKPKTPDTSAQEKRLNEQEQQADAQARELAKKEAAKRKARSSGGQRSLLTGTETGVKRDSLS